MQAKKRVREVLDRLPDDCTMDDVLYHLYLIKSVEKGLEDVEAGRTIPHAQVVEELRKKWLVGDEGVIWAESARDDVDDAVTYLAERSRDAALLILSAAFEAAASLDENAERGRVVPEIGDLSIRELFLHKYRLIYQVSEDSVHVLAFLHGSRDFVEWARERGGRPYN